MGRMRFDKIGVDTWQRLGAAVGGAYQQGKQQDEVEKIINDKPVDSNSLSTEQNEEVFQSLADGGTARDVQNDDGSFGGVAVSKPMPEGVEGPAPAQTLAPQKITTYLGREFVGGLDPAKATSARNRALANVITKGDPLQGIKLDALLTQTDREDQEYGDKQKVRTLQQQLAGESDPLKKFGIGRQLAALPGGGEVVKGFGDIEQANYRAVVNHARGFMDKDDFGGAMNVYNQYDNGEDGEVVKLQGGGYQLNFYAGKPGEGNLTSSKTFKNGEEVKQWFNDRFDPEAAVKRQAESATNTLKFNNEIKKAVAIEQAKSLVREGTLRPGYKWGTDENGEDIQVRADGTGGAGSSRGKKKAPATPDEMASGLFMEAIKQTSSQQNVFTPEQINSGDTAARSAMSLNPGIKPEVAASAGMVFANAKPGSTVFGWDAATNSAVEQVQTPQGLVAVNRVTHRNAAARQMPPEKLKLAVESSISRLTGGDEAKRPKIIAAAFDSTGKARRALLDEAKTELMSMPQFKQLSPQGQAEALKTHERNVDAALSVPLGWIRNFGQDLNQ